MQAGTGCRRVGVAPDYRQPTESDLHNGTFRRQPACFGIGHAKTLTDKFSDQVFQSAPLGDGTQFGFAYKFIREFKSRFHEASFPSSQFAVKC